MNLTFEELEALASTIAKLLSRYSKEENFGIREHIRWMFDHENKHLAFLGKASYDSNPTYYSYLRVRELANKDQQLKKALSHLLALGYEITLWRDTEDVEGRNEELDFVGIDVDEYKQLLIAFPPVIIHNQKEADRVSRVIDKILDNLDSYSHARQSYCLLLKVLLNDWEIRKVSEGRRIIQSEQSENIPF